MEGGIDFRPGHNGSRASTMWEKLLIEGTNRAKSPLLVTIISLEARHETQAGFKRGSKRYLYGGSGGSADPIASLRYRSGDG
ncbi:protein of unknown function [Agrobacterium pusense]|uniref:Uncharacterized protein n=1 Tax=Agrobacterium pusense TaxID=648995 RepID=U4Q081_9HYPH|nr:protein of unknown function [Agrobacterium pusense]